MTLARYGTHWFELTWFTSNYCRCTRWSDEAPDYILGAVHYWCQSQYSDLTLEEFLNKSFGPPHVHNYAHAD